MEDSKYFAIVEWAKKTIEERGLTAGDRFFSEAELCRIHSVSRQTVRAALSVMENQNIIMRRQGSGTFVQSTGKQIDPHNFIVGVISTYFSDYIFPSIVTGIERVLTRNHAVMQLTTTGNLVAEEARALQAMLAQNVRGLIIEPSKSALPNPNMALYQEIRERNIPVVFFNAKYPGIASPLVAMDDVAAAETVTGHLIQQGHKRISAILASDDIQGHKRYTGFMRCLNKGGIYLPETRVVWFSTQEKPTLFTHSEQKILALLKESTAVVCYNDALAVGLLEFCKLHGISVPGDMAVVGMDDSMLARICEVPLTTVRHPQQLLGEQAAEVILSMINDPQCHPDDMLFRPELVGRASTAKAGKLSVPRVNADA